MEEGIEHKLKYTSGKASYVERNQAMINDSDYCVFCVDENSEHLEATKTLKHAKRKKKEIVNILQTV